MLRLLVAFELVLLCYESCKDELILEIRMEIFEVDGMAFGEGLKRRDENCSVTKRYQTLPLRLLYQDVNKKMNKGVRLKSATQQKHNPC